MPYRRFCEIIEKLRIADASVHAADQYGVRLWQTVQCLDAGFTGCRDRIIIPAYAVMHAERRKTVRERLKAADAAQNIR